MGVKCTPLVSVDTGLYVSVWSEFAEVPGNLESAAAIVRPCIYRILCLQGFPDPKCRRHLSNLPKQLNSTLTCVPLPFDAAQQVKESLRPHDRDIAPVQHSGCVLNSRQEASGSEPYPPNWGTEFRDDVHGTAAAWAYAGRCAGP
jgi:hypothetical protein